MEDIALHKLAQVVSGHIFGAAKEFVFNEEHFPIQHWKGGSVRGVDIWGYRFLTQNPAKKSKWGKLAQQGHKIVWVIRNRDNVWMCKCVDGEVSTA